jgi:hypothetical protein
MTGSKANLYACPRCEKACIWVIGDKDGPAGWECLVCGALWPT